MNKEKELWTQNIPGRTQIDWDENDTEFSDKEKIEQLESGGYHMSLFKNKETLADKRIPLTGPKIYGAYPEKDVKRFIQEFIDEVLGKLCKEYFDRRNRKGFTISSMDRISQIEIIKVINKLAKQKFGGLV